MQQGRRAGLPLQPYEAPSLSAINKAHDPQTLVLCKHCSTQVSPSLHLPQAPPPLRRTQTQLTPPPHSPCPLGWGREERLRYRPGYSYIMASTAAHNCIAGAPPRNCDCGVTAVAKRKTGDPGVFFPLGLLAGFAIGGRARS